MGDALHGFGLTDNDRNLLDKIRQDLPLLADLARADLLLYCATESADAVEVIAETRPRFTSSGRPASLPLRKVTREDDPEAFRVLEGGKGQRFVRRAISWGSPSARQILPITNGGRIIGALSIDLSPADHKLDQRRDPVLQRAIAQVRNMILAGELAGAKNISPLGEHDGPLVVDRNRQILYTSAIAENLYRKLGYCNGLLGSKITDLGTDESAYYRALETGICAEDVVNEGSLVLVKKAIPLVATERKSRWDRLIGAAEEIDGVMLVIHDATEERRKEQELKIKATMIQEVHHRVKNNLQTIAALLRLQSRRTGSEQVIEMLQQTINRILSVAVVHEFLSHDEDSVINVKDVCQRILDEVTQAVLDPEKRIRFVLNGGNIYLPAQQATACALIVNELLQNAVEHGFSNRWTGTVAINLEDDGSALKLEIVDDGQGLPPGFSVSKGANLGLQIVDTLVREDLRGEFELVSGVSDNSGLVKSGGARATVIIPRTQRSQKTTLSPG